MGFARAFCAPPHVESLAAAQILRNGREGTHKASGLSHENHKTPRASETESSYQRLVVSTTHRRINDARGSPPADAFDERLRRAMWSEWLEATVERPSVVAEISEPREPLPRVETVMNDYDVGHERSSAWAARRQRAQGLD